MSDINTYSLSLNLDVQSNADAVLDDTTSLLSDIQSQLDKMSGSIGVGMRDASAEVANAIADIAQQSTIAEKSMASMVPQMAAAGASAASSATHYENLADSLEDAVEEHENITDEMTDQEELLMDALEHHEDIEDSIEKQVGLFDDITKSLDNNIKRLRTTVLGMEAISRAWGMLIEDEERFVTANYRFHGTQREMIDQVAQITDEYGLMYDSAMEAYTALSTELRVPREELAKFTEQAAKFNRITGANVQISAQWIKTMKFIGYTAKDTERMLGTMTAAMEKYGLSTQETEKYLTDMTASTGQAIINWGSDQVEAYQQSELELRGLARGLDHLQAYWHQNLIEPGSKSSMILRKLAEDHDSYAKSTEGLVGAQLQAKRVELGTIAVYEKLQEQLAGVTDERERYLKGQALFQKLAGMDKMAAGEAIVLMEKFEKAGIEAGDSTTLKLQKLVDAMGEAEKMAFQYEQSMNTLKGEWKKATSSMEAVFMQMVTAIAPQVIWLIKNVLMPIIDVVKTIVKVLTAAFKVVMIVLYPVIKVVEAIINVFRGLWSVVDDVLSPFIEIIDIIYKALFEGTEAGIGFADVFQFIGKVIGYVTTFFLQPLVWLFKGIAAALTWMRKGTSAFGSVIKAVFFPLGALIKVISLAVEGLVWVFGSLWDVIKTVFGSVFKGIMSSAVGIFEGFWSVVKGIFDPFKAIFVDVMGVFKELWATIKQWFDPMIVAFDTMKRVFSEGEESGMSLATVFSYVGKALGWVVRFAIMPLTLAVQIAGKVIGFLARIVKDVVAFALTPLKWAIDFVTAGIEVVTGSVILLKEWFSSLTAEGTMLGETFNVLGSITEAIADPLGALGSVLESVIGWFGASGAGIIEESEWLAEAFEMLTGPAEMIVEVMRAVGGAMEVVVDAVDNLVASVVGLSKNWDTLLAGTMVMFAFGATLLGAAGMIFAGSSLMMIAGPMFLAGMGALAVGLWLFDVDKMNEIADSLWSLATGIVAIGRAKDQLSGIGNAIYEVANQVQAIGSSIVYVTSILWTSAAGLLGFSTYLGYIYGVIASVISSGMDKIEAEAQRAWAIMVPLQFMAGGLGLSLADLMDIGKYFDEPIQAETISQVQVLTDDEGGKVTEEVKTNRWRDEQLNILRGIDSKMDKIGAGGNVPGLDEIQTLLANWLPKIGKSPSKLATNMNDWQ